MIDAMVDKLVVKPSYGHHVTSVERVYLPPHKVFPHPPPGSPWRPWHRYPFPLMKVRTAGKGDEYFSHVVSTVSFANLGIINTDKVPMTYKQRQAIRTLMYGPAIKVGIKFKTRWWEQVGIEQHGGSSYTDRPVRVVVYPSYGMGEEGPGVLMVSYSWCVGSPTPSCSVTHMHNAEPIISRRHQDASRFGALIQNPDWSEQLDPDRKRPWSEQVLLDRIYEDLAALHGVTIDWLREQTLDYHAFDWYHNPHTMGAFAHFGPGQFSTFFADIVQPAAHGRFHFAGEVASHHHAWIAGALDSAVRVVNEIIRWDFPIWHAKFREEHGRSLVFSDEKSAQALFVRGLFSEELKEAEAEIEVQG